MRLLGGLGPELLGEPDEKTFKLAFHAGCELKTEHLLTAVSDVRRLAPTDPDRIAKFTERLERHIKPAGGDAEPAHAANANGRVRRLRVAVSTRQRLPSKPMAIEPSRKTLDLLAFRA